LGACKWFFWFTHWMKKMALHMCGPISGFFYSYGWKKKMMLHICEPTSDFFNFTCEKKIKWYCTFASLQMVFIYIDEEKRLYCTLARLTWVVFFSTHIGDKTKWYFPRMCLWVIFFNPFFSTRIITFLTCNLISVFWIT